MAAFADRSTAWDRLGESWDLIVVGGGITGAGILVEAVRLGLRTLLVEQADFASGASSRSSKLVHGGLRYLKNHQVKVTFEAVRERDRLLREGPGLVSGLDFMLAAYRSDRIPGWEYGLGLAVYDLLAGRWDHRRFSPEAAVERCPLLASDDLGVAYEYLDAETDDSRLVLRLLHEAPLDLGLALNYARAAALLTSADGSARGVRVEDTSGRGLPDREVEARVVINATGAWADELRRAVGGTPRLRRLRGSHLVFPTTRFPLNRAVSFGHPADGRAMFAIPWEGVTLVGTTDLDHDRPLDTETAISPQETEYLLDAAARRFPAQELEATDIQSVYSGIRPVIDTGKADPGKESREHVMWTERGLLTVAGGKLTTFRPMAHSALERVRSRLGIEADIDRHRPTLDPTPLPADLPSPLDAAARLRLLGRYGADAPAVATAGRLDPVNGSTALWAELVWTAGAEAVVHLDDLLLRRARLGLTLPKGGIDQLPEIRAAVQPALGWDDARWNQEADRYRTLWRRWYGPPDGTAGTG
jgi:glycerol-3-phosphate dehydrogenase